MNAVADDPLREPVELIHRWGFFLDNLPDWMGGFSVGELLLRSDGRPSSAWRHRQSLAERDDVHAGPVVGVPPSSPQKPAKAKPSHGS